MGCAALFFAACGDDGSSAGGNWGDEPYCVVKESKSGVTQEIYEPGKVHGESGVSFKGENVVVFAEETFLYENSSVWKNACKGLEKNKDMYDEGSFKCNSEGASFTITQPSSDAQELSDIVSEMREECADLAEAWKADVEDMSSDEYVEKIRSSGSGANAKSSSSGKSASSSSYGDGHDMSSGSKTYDERVFVVSEIKNEPNYNAFTDKRDGHAYRVKRVGEHMWMMDNLRYGGSLDKPLKGNVSVNASDSERDVSNRLAVVTYDYSAAINVSGCNEEVCNAHDSLIQGICPDGWVIPPKSEWEYLIDHLEDMDEFFDYPYTGEVTSGEYWVNDGISRYWASTEDGARGAWEWYYRSGSLDVQSYSKEYQYGLRCVAVKDVVLDTYLDPVKKPGESSSSGGSSVSSSDDGYSSSRLSSSSSSRDVEYGEFTDHRDGTKYRFYTVGNLKWTVDNMRYVGGRMLNTWCMGREENLCDNGMLYAFKEAQEACPEDWRLPTLQEWNQLHESVGGDENFLDIMNFTPTGESNGYVTSVDNVARYWTSTSDGDGDADGAHMIYIYTETREFNSQTYRKDYGYGVRCVQEVLTESP